MADLLKILPLAIVMIAGPQVLSAVLLATSKQAKRDSAGFVVGATLAVTVGVSISYLIASALHTKVETPATTPGGVPLIDWLILGLLILLMLRVFLKRKTSTPPKWMGTVQDMSPKAAFRLGALLFIAMPTDIVTMITVGTYLASRGDPLWNAIPFVLLTGLLVAVPLLILVLMGARAETILPKVRDRMNAKSWVVSELVLGLFVLLVGAEIVKKL